MFFRRSKTPPPTDIDSRLAAFDRAYAGMFPGEAKPWESATAAASPSIETAKTWLLGKTRWWWFTRASAGLLLLFILIVFWLAITAPLSKSLQPIAPPRITLLAWDGTPIARNGAIVDKPVEVEKLPPHVVQAFLSIEDRRFYSHWGVDPRSIARALWSNTFGSGLKQGGSTITQQLAKFTFLTPERSLTRKAREALIAFWLEAWLTKDEILERYLSNAYFGDNIYGLRAASMHYFYRKPENLTLSQAAMLAGLVQAPNRLAPTRNPQRAAKRAKLVLNAMVATGAISEAKADATPIARIDVRYKETLPTGTYFADWAMPQARLDAETGYSDQVIRTTLDSRLQNIARNVIARAPLGKAQVALVAMRPNGEVVAMVGGKSYKESPFNRATQAKRQPGSTFKLFVYTAALRSGMTPDSKVDDSPIIEGAYRPKNYSERYRGEITLKQAFAQSSNVVAVRLYNQLGYSAVARAAKDLGVQSPLTRDASLALGSSGMTLLELTSAYAGVAGNKWPVEPRAFVAEDEGWFGWLLSAQRSFSNAQHKALLELLGATVNQGTGRAARLSIPAYGKTGTSQDYRDALFIGFAGDLVVGVWIGNDDNTPLRNMTGGGLPARIWRDFMGQAVKGAGARPKPKPAVEPDPTGPIEPLDLPEIPELPVNINGTEVRVDPGKGVTVSGQIEGVPLDVTFGRDGVNVQPREEPARRQ
ncbi:transglycosylase domain-containing protein [uncultured Sphingorhabdus sp.]|uniref:transglycosylase domain-containing protein n=1 Tax=uncultured Sphingorhabdus sp. TaxID=1686106 RepID=UPI00260417B4|nr:PBP1A family penicillin-binding protein [uncultured Sphingorhabdus sp.]HMS20404.1 PBP1A family penicillin-binding protein [Sphingorhabdus sp.]